MELTNPQEVEAKVDARYRVFLILWIAILISIGILFALHCSYPVRARRINKGISDLVLRLLNSVVVKRTSWFRF
jgi:hypothetical protein